MHTYIHIYRMMYLWCFTSSFRHEQGRCHYSEMPDMYNSCPYAHSQQELDEWKERFEFRQMKREIARKDHVFSYMDTLLEDYASTSDGVNVVSYVYLSPFSSIHNLLLIKTNGSEAAGLTTSVLIDD